jgi:hypothetical protein
MRARRRFALLLGTTVDSLSEVGDYDTSHHVECFVGNNPRVSRLKLCKRRVQNAPVRPHRRVADNTRRGERGGGGGGEGRWQKE